MMRGTLALLTFLLWAAVSPASHGQAGDSRLAARPAAASARVGPAIASDDSVPVAVPEPGESAVRFYRGDNALWCIRRAWELFVPGLLLFSGWSARMRDRAERITRSWFIALAIYVLAFLAVRYVLDLPLNWYQGFYRLHAYRLSNQSFGRWLGQSFKQGLVEAAGGVAFLWIPYWLMRRSPRRWWLQAWIAATVASVLVVFITPVWIDPLFNRFGPMTDKSLEADILDLAERADVEGSRVYEVDKSADTRFVNAYVTGFLGTKRIVLWDTLIAKLDRRELLTVAGHELGHYVLGHVMQGTLLGSALALIGLYLLHRISGPCVRICRHRFGFDRLSDMASLPLILLFLSAGQLAVDPLILAVSRHMEHEADRFALEITRDNQAFARAEVKLASENLGVPRPGSLYRLWRASHPSVAERIEFANRYRPWAQGGVGKYDRLFAPRPAVPGNRGR
jgi:Zn-dependent protease with chaperone function